jgi:hypothetical protein
MAWNRRMMVRTLLTKVSKSDRRPPSRFQILHGLDRLAYAHELLPTPDSTRITQEETLIAYMHFSASLVSRPYA